MTKGFYKRNLLETLHTLVWDTAESLRDTGTSIEKSKLLKTLSRKLFLARDLCVMRNPVRVGVFGMPKRGKTTLINALLGVEGFLPSALIPTTACVVEVANGWGRKIEIRWESGKCIKKDDMSDTETLGSALKRFGIEKSAPHEKATRIRIEWPLLTSKLLSRGYVLFDTPGCEPSESGGSSPVAEPNTERSLAELESCHVVLFCMSAEELGNKAEVELFRNHVEWMDPLVVINMSDKWEDTEDPVDYVTSKVFFMERDKAIAVSATRALLAKKWSNDALWNQSRIGELEDRVEGSISDMCRPGLVIKSVLEGLSDFAKTDDAVPGYAARGRFFAAVRHPDVERRDELIALIQQFPGDWFGRFLTGWNEESGRRR
jgi:hypothetical protein